MANLTLARALKAELDQLRPLSAEDERRVMDKFRLEWNYHSNNLEGNSLSYGETKALLLHGLTAQGKPLKDHFEMTGHDEALKWIFEVVQEQRPINETFIKQLHTLLLKTPYEVDAITPDGQPTKKRIQVGTYKQTPNHVRTATGEIFRFATPEETPALMHDLLQWLRSESTKVNFDPIATAIEFHYRFIRIHPFDDGNGRTCRILMNFILMANGYPPVIIKTEDKEQYFTALRQADAGNLDAFVDFVVDNLLISLQLIIDGAKGKAIGEADDLDRELLILERKLEERGEGIGKIKSTDSLFELYEKSFQFVIDKFIATNRKFDKFYQNSYAVVSSNMDYYQVKRDFSDVKTITKKVIQVADRTQYLQVAYQFDELNKIKLESPKYRSSIRFDFEDEFYTISLLEKEVSISKLYDEYLSEDEVNNLMNQLGYQHKAFIESKFS